MTPAFPKENNFDLLRTAFSYMVVLSHARFLYGLDSGFFPFNLPAVGVDGFFVISGFLMTWSLNRQSDPKPYAIKRALRILPAYCLIVTAQTILFSQLIKPDYSEILRYFAANIVFLNFLKPAMGSALDGLRVPAINGSLWTLKVEVAFYVLLPLVLILYRRFGGSILACLFAASCVYGLVFPSGKWPQQVPGQFRFFAVGIACFYHGHLLKRFGAWPLFAGLGGLILTWALWQIGWSPAERVAVVLDPLFMGLFVYGAAFTMPLWPIRTDLSYSTYLIHFPLIQLSLLEGFFVQNFWLFLVYVLAVTTGLAWLVSRFVEKPCMDLGRRLAA